MLFLAGASPDYASRGVDDRTRRDSSPSQHQRICGQYSFGLERALDIYPPDSAQALGYDAARVFILAFPIWVGSRLIFKRKPNE